MRNSNKEISFNKYLIKGAYHWSQISKNIFKRNSFVIARYKNVIELINSKIKSKGSNILDVGCGDGVLANMLWNNGFQNITGIDVQDEAIYYAEEKTKHTNIVFIKSDVYKLSFKKKFDILISTEVIEHLVDVENYLLQLKRFTKEGGYIIISTPIKNTKFPVDPMHHQEWYKEDFKELLNRHFPNSEYFYSHPIFWKELYERKYRFKILLEVFSIFGFNVFSGFNKNWKHHTIQYCIVQR